MKSENCGKYCEIGARHGDTFHYIVDHVDTIYIATAVDLPGGAWGARASLASFNKAVENLGLRGTERNLHVFQVLGDSTQESIIKQVADHGPYDFIFIDGDHRYNGVKADWDNYRKLTRFIAFHDIAGEGQTAQNLGRDPVEVPRLWAELKLQYPTSHQEFIAPNSKMGIGVIQVQE